jgi:hypothetical protein
VWNKVKSVSEIRVKRINLTLRIKERRNKLKECEWFCNGASILRKSMLTGIEFCLEVLRKYIENINRSVIGHWNFLSCFEKRATAACLQRVGKLSFACPIFPHCILIIVKNYLHFSTTGSCGRQFITHFSSVLFPSKSSMSEGWRRSFPAPTLTCGKLYTSVNISVMWWSPEWKARKVSTISVRKYLCHCPAMRLLHGFTKLTRGCRLAFRARLHP